MELKAEVKIEEHTCASEGCGVSFWVSEAFGGRRRDDHKTFYCPNGHTLVYKGETDSQKLARVRNEKDHEINRLNEVVRIKEREIKRCKRKPRTKKP